MTTNPERDAAPPLQADSADVIVGERIHQLMWRKRMPQRELGEIIGVQQNTMSKKLRGARTWTLDELLAIAAYLRVPVTELLPGDDYVPVPTGRGRSGVDQYAIRDSNPEPAD